MTLWLGILFVIKIFSPFSIEITAGIKTTKFVVNEISYTLKKFGVY